MLRKSRITVSGCALVYWLRLASIMKEIGVAEDNFGHLVSEVYNKCKTNGLQPEYIAYNVKRGEASTAIQVELQNLTADKGTLQKVSRRTHIFNSFRNLGFHNFL